MQKVIKKIFLSITCIFMLCLFAVGCGKQQVPVQDRQNTSSQDISNYRNYKLEENVYLKDGQFIQILENTVLDLNGYAIVGNNNYVIQVGSVDKIAQFVLTDSRAAGITHYLQYSKTNNCYSRYALEQEGGVDATAAPTFLPDSYIQVQGGLITGGSGSLSGGGIYIYEGSKVDMRGGTLAGNSSLGCGGAVFVGHNGMFTLSGGEIKGNSSAGYAGGIYVSESKVNLAGGNIIGNTAVAGGGGVYALSSEVNLSAGLIAGNKARFGGGINAISSIVSVFGGTVEGNLAQEGGGLGLFNSNLEMLDGNIQKNQATKLGGGIKFAQTEGSATFHLSGGNIIENNALRGGGLYLLRTTVYLSGGNIQRNIGIEGDNSIYNFEDLASVYREGSHIDA